ncbi:hypothetical protein FVER14953_21407 [Fusarium verticillioides]|nr:hypothetical protein FVER14953_21407 [Fusarium verticillioides]
MCADEDPLAVDEHPAQDDTDADSAIGDVSGYFEGDRSS